MPEVIIYYEKPETLKILRSLSRYLNFTLGKKKHKKTYINGVEIISASSDIDPDDLAKLFTERNIDASTLRKNAWMRNK